MTIDYVWNQGCYCVRNKRFDWGINKTLDITKKKSNFHITFALNFTPFSFISLIIFIFKTNFIILQIWARLSSDIKGKDRKQNKEIIPEIEYQQKKFIYICIKIGSNWDYRSWVSNFDNLTFQASNSKVNDELTLSHSIKCRVIIQIRSWICVWFTFNTNLFTNCKTNAKQILVS